MSLSREDIVHCLDMVRDALDAYTGCLDHFAQSSEPHGVTGVVVRNEPDCITCFIGLVEPVKGEIYFLPRRLPTAEAFEYFQTPESERDAIIADKNYGFLIPEGIPEEVFLEGMQALASILIGEVQSLALHEHQDMLREFSKIRLSMKK